MGGDDPRAAFEAGVSQYVILSAGLAIPPNLCFVPVDFANQGLGAALGFTDVRYLGPEEADVRYLAARRDGLRAGLLVGLMCAGN